MTRSGDPPYCPDLGDLIFLDFSPHLGVFSDEVDDGSSKESTAATNRTEQGFTRPGLVLTPRSYNGLVGRCFACPVTSRGRGYPYEVALPPGLKIHGYVLADQGKPLAWAERYARFADIAPADVIDETKAKIAAFLQLV